MREFGAADGTVLPRRTETGPADALPDEHGPTVEPVDMAHSAERAVARREGRNGVEAGVGIEPALTALQAAA
jgi:hypothetical protein